jgi:exopolyphosphatase/guanosine-5'-triphosphate,3'-diphosphate pyrophosphatase
VGVTERLALLEFGSNAARFVLARITRGSGYELIRQERARTRLGSGSSRLRMAAVRNTVEAAARFLRSVHEDRPPRVLAVGTAAVRDDASARGLLAELRRTASIEVEVLSGAEEARLGAEAARASLSLSDALVVDLGGGSMQLTRLRDGAIEPLGSLPLGAVRMTDRFLRHDPPRPGELRALRHEVRAYLAPHRLAEHRQVPLIGLGGTVRAVARLHLAVDPEHRSSVHGLRLTRQEVATRAVELARLPVARRQGVPGLKAERADIIVAGVIILEELLMQADQDAFFVCDRGLRHGLLLRETFGTAVRG